MINVILFLFVWLGHACLMMVILNITYSQPIHRNSLKKFRLFIGGIIFLGFPTCMAIMGRSIEDWLTNGWEDGILLLGSLYLSVCLLISAVLLPLITVQRNLRRPPTAILSETTETYDVEKSLGFRPIGEGKYKKLAAIPINGLFHVDFTTLTLAVPELPMAWDGLVILQLSDIHFIGTPGQEYYDWIVKKCMSDGAPDLLMITGDILDTHHHHRWIIPVLGQLRWNIAAFAILGNHDYWYDHGKARRRLSRLKMHEIGNRWKQIEVRGEPLTVIGHEGPWFRPGPDLSETPATGFRICLSHTPDNFRWCQTQQVRLMLSGHNHGGQIRLPIFGSLFVPSKFSRRYDMGTFQKGPTILHVNRGLAGKEPIRLRCHPQVTRIILRRTAKS